MSIHIDRSCLILKYVKNRVFNNQALKEITANHGDSKQILTPLLMHQGEESREPLDAVKINLSIEDALGGNARILFDYLAKKDDYT